MDTPHQFNQEKFNELLEKKRLADEQKETIRKQNAEIAEQVQAREANILASKEQRYQNVLAQAEKFRKLFNQEATPEETESFEKEVASVNPTILDDLKEFKQDLYKEFNLNN